MHPSKEAMSLNVLLREEAHLEVDIQNKDTVESAPKQVIMDLLRNHFVC